MGEETATSPPATTTTAPPTKVKPPAEGAAAPPESPSTPRNGRLSSDATSGVSHHNNHSATTSPAPPPSAASAVPFAWEEHPGVPKANSKPPGSVSPPTAPDQRPASTASPSRAAAKALPLPPPLCKLTEAAGRAKKRPGTGGGSASSWRPGGQLAADPFAAALVTCSRGDGVDEEETGREKKGALVGYWRWGRRRRSWGLLVGDRFGMASCMHATPAGAVMDSTVRVPRHTAGPSRRPLAAATASASASSYGVHIASRRSA